MFTSGHVFILIQPIKLMLNQMVFTILGAFLLPYFIMVVLAGIPMFLLEVSIGQFMSAGGIRVWNISPLFTGMHQVQAH